MSYDIVCAPRLPGQSWDDVMDELESEEDGAPLAAQARAAWERIVPRVREVLGEVELFESDETVELTHMETGIQVSLYAGSAAVTVPYWTSGEAADTVLRLVYRIAEIVEAETGMEAYDPQNGVSVRELTDRHRSAQVSSFGRVRRMLRRRLAE